MNRILLSVLLLSQPLSAAVAEPELELRGYISAWTQDCAGSSCQLPKPGERNRPVLLRLALPAAPGEAVAAVASERLVLPGGGELQADINFYAICPYVGKSGLASPGPLPLSGGALGEYAERGMSAQEPKNCAGRYFQAQVSLSGRAGAFCAAALNAVDFTPFPVLICAGAAPDGTRFGLTLHRQPF
ncbi:MAG: hypothetical protein COX65_03045 [Elusimicrobia bacterium CG_4_10_14_0_2_um_filter_56_8]|nr:MAG: hypothetical protein COX65_03045 [Elusimicrobia bacterium CG_4_10_14_0_2_um_filter_56_8]